MSINQLILHFDQYLSLNEEEKRVIYDKVHERKIKRRQFLLQEGDVCKNYYFISQGCFKMYFVDAKGGEHNIQFAAENDWITDIGSFHSESPSKLYIEAMEPSVVFQISRLDLLFMYENYPKFDRNFRVLIEDKFVALQNRLLENISSTAESRYLNFLNQYPHLSNRISNIQIASYIGITPEFLSTIRKRIANQ